jgi:phosphatidate cytidylyltransferase
LCPRLSPHKTVEGLIGGIVMAAAIAALLRFLLPSTTLAHVIVLGLVTAAGAVAGDLAFSALKRHAGLKDFSTALPGHGGVLDRFDSLVLAAPAFYWSAAVLG